MTAGRVELDAVRIKVVMQADAQGPLPLFVATSDDPQITASGRTLDELRENLQRAIAEALSDQVDENGNVPARAILLEFAA